MGIAENIIIYPLWQSSGILPIIVTPTAIIRVLHTRSVDKSLISLEDVKKVIVNEKKVIDKYPDLGYINIIG
jgi:hypothetical protein